MSEVANRTRGEVSLLLDGVPQILRPSFTAIEAFEAATGKSIVELAFAADRSALPLADIGSIVTHCMRAQGAAVGDTGAAGANLTRVKELLIEGEGGVLLAQKTIALLLFDAATGGYTASGEAKAAAETGTVTDPSIPAAA